MDWMTLTVLTTTEGADIVSQQLIEAGSKGTMIEDRNDYEENQRPQGQWDILDESLFRDMGKDVRVTGYYPRDERAMDALSDLRFRLDALRRAGGPVDFGKLEILTGGVDDEDWAECWKKDYVPFRIGKHIVVKPGWTRYEAKPGDRVLEIDPGMAFGTGTHETTGLCVELMEEYLNPGDTVIDVGTGTGILAIAALLCGAKSALATDIDPMAVRVAAQNIEINGFSDRIRTRAGDLLEAVDESETAELVSANIIADVVASLAAPVRSRIRDGGVFLCSGIAREKREKVVAALYAAGYHDLDIREKGEWCAIAARK